MLALVANNLMVTRSQYRTSDNDIISAQYVYDQEYVFGIFFMICGYVSLFEHLIAESTIKKVPFFIIMLNVYLNWN